MSTTQPSLNTKVPPPHLTYFTFADNAVILCFHTVAISFYTHILYCYYFKRNKLKTNSMAKSLLIFFWTHLICAVSDVPYHTYVVVKWNPANQENYDPYVLYWTGISVSVYYNLTSLSVLLLSLDRLLTLLSFHHHKNKNLKKWFLRVTVIFLLGFSIYPIVDYLMMLPLDKDKLRYCQSQSCVASSLNSFVPNLRLLILVINLLISGSFLWTFRSVSKKQTVNIRVVKMAIVLEIAFNALPSLAVTVSKKVTQIDLYGIVGPILTVIITANIAFSAAYTWFILVKRTKDAVISLSITQDNPRITPIVE
ncbi:hypothetical protein DdX_15549 [Ditylenchus destructor]|uniref:Uncharacterized protein n=1 Tax=Ditylenchus destructor TaxID=166010 RepID=A0AAD4QUM2_9BILA|nr:hypothetical protein DdX_15549 [Ditylenchus destructor]